MVQGERTERKVTCPSNGLISRGPYVINERKGDFGKGLTGLECASPLLLAHHCGEGATLARGFFPELVGLIPVCCCDPSKVEPTERRSVRPGGSQQFPPVLTFKIHVWSSILAFLGMLSGLVGSHGSHRSHQKCQPVAPIRVTGVDTLYDEDGYCIELKGFSAV